MQNLLAAAQSAAFRAITAHVAQDTDLATTLGQVCRVETHLRQDTKPPYLKVAATSSETEAEGYDQVERITIEVLGVWRGQSSTPLLDMLHSARVALDGQTIESDVAICQPPYFLSTNISEPLNGDTYIGLMIFETMVEPA